MSLLPKGIFLLFTLFWYLCAGTLFYSSAKACVICFPYPEITLADRLLEQDDLIFAREVAGNPYNFFPVAVIQGTAEKGSFPLFCNSAIRRKLLAIPESVVVLGRLPGDEEWNVLTFADTAEQSFVRLLVKESKLWGGPQGKERRQAFFAQFLSSENKLIQEQAFLEVGRAPYSTIKKLASAVPRHKLYRLLRNYQYVEWHNLYILMLGQSPNPEDHKYIREKVETAARVGSTTNLAAWVTAFVETNPAAGVAEIEKWYFRNQHRSRGELERVLTSFSVLGSQAPADGVALFILRREIVRSYAALLEVHPAFAGLVAKDLAMWRIRAYTAQFDKIRNTGILDPEGAYLIDYYLSMSKRF